MSNPTIRIHDLATDKVIDREMNAAELKAFKEEQEAFAAEKAKADQLEAHKAAAQAKLAALGLTADDLNALGL